MIKKYGRKVFSKPLYPVTHLLLKLFSIIVFCNRIVPGNHGPVTSGEQDGIISAFMKHLIEKYR